MIPILFDENATTFTTNGLGSLSDATMCVVTEERNGSYELEMEYIEGGAHFNEIQVSKIIYAKPSQMASPQPFRIYKITKPLNKRVQIFAQHISYELSFIPVIPFTANGATDAMNGLKTNSVTPNNYTVQCTVSKSGTFAPETPASFRNMIGGMEGSILDVYGGELEWDNKTVKLHANRGTNRGLTLRYGKNIVDINQEESIEETITGVMPFLKDQVGNTLYLTPKIVASATASNFPYPRNVVMDMASYVDEKAIRDANPTDTEAQIEAKLRAAMLSAAQAYITNNNIGIPEVSIDVEYVNLGDTEEYKDLQGIFAQAGLCDTVQVIFERLNISTTAKIVRTEWNVLLDRYERVTIGSMRSSLSGTLASVQQTAETTEDALINTQSSIMQEVTADIAAAVADATAAITGQTGGYLKINYVDDKPYELLIMDSPSQATAVKVWRWNLSGLGYSGNGYNGTYAFALTNDGKIVADRILSGEMEGQYIKAGSVTLDRLTAVGQQTLAQDEQYIYYAKANTTAPSATTTWVTDATGGNNKWTTKRPQYSQSYPYCYLAKQKKDAAGAVTCTTPAIDDTTTVIDGGHIITGTITAGMISGQLTNDQIADLAATKLSGQINTGSIGWIKLSDGTFSLANGNFKYTNGSYLELYNNLSLRLNGVPLSGRWYTGITAHSDFTNVNKEVIEYPSFVLVHLRFTLPKKTVAANSVIFENFWVNQTFSVFTVPIINLTNNDFSQSFAALSRTGSLHAGRYGQIKNTAQIGNSSADRDYEINLIYPVDWSEHIDP